MPAYATQADMERFVEWETENAEALERLLERASRTIDRAFPHLPIRTTGTFAGFRFDPTELEAWERDALAEATAYQAEYRNELGETAYAGAGRAVIREKGPDFELQYAESSGGAGGDFAPKAAEPLRRLVRFRAFGARARA